MRYGTAERLASTSTASDEGTWGVLWPLLLTAGLTLLATAFVQLYVVPRVETRKRREDRWERDVLELGRLLSREQREAADTLWHGLISKASLGQMGEDPSTNPAALGRERQKNEDRLREAYAQYQRIDERIDWLVERVTSIDPWAEAMIPFQGAYVKYQMAQIQMTTGHFRPDDNPLAQEVVTTNRKTERDAVHILIVHVKALAKRSVPRSTIRQRVSRRWKQWIAPIARWRVKRQVAGQVPASVGNAEGSASLSQMMRACRRVKGVGV